SAGWEPGTLHPLAVEVMREIGIDISKNRTKDVVEFLRQGRSFDYVITVCEAAAAGRCPVFPGAGKKMHWAFEDPSLFTGTYQEKLNKTRALRDAIKAAVERFVAAEMRAVA
ncbi:MAG TPA: arsenate reductase ArsC, partial [Chitinophagales bacterium]|nr:arsenate reductase ArsC [Chitinophagales bacterium]